MCHLCSMQAPHTVNAIWISRLCRGWKLTGREGWCLYSTREQLPQCKEWAVDGIPSRWVSLRCNVRNGSPKLTSDELLFGCAKCGGAPQVLCGPQHNGQSPLPNDPDLNPSPLVMWPNRKGNFILCPLLNELFRSVFTFRTGAETALQFSNFPSNGTA